MKKFQTFLMGDSSYRQNFYQSKKNEIQHHSYKERLRMSKTAKIGNEENIYSPVKFANFVYICITHGKITTFGSKMVIFPRVMQIQYIQNLRTSPGYIFSLFYNNSQPNFAFLLILRCSFQPNGFRSSCLDQNFVI